MASVEYLKGVRRSKKRQFDALAKRRDKLNRIINRSDDDFDWDINAINKRIDKCAQNLLDGLKYGEVSHRTADQILDLKEQKAYCDSCVSGATYNLRSERSRCQGEINRLDGEIHSLENQIRDEGGTIYPWE